MKTIGILTTFYSFDPGYSLTSVVRDQLRALVSIGYQPVLFVLAPFKDDALVPEGVEIRKIVPQLLLEPYKGTGFPDYWKEDVEKARAMFEKNMQDIDILFVHDILFIDTFLPYNIALRDALPSLKCKVYAWTHSAPSTRPKLEDNPHASRYNLGTDPRIKLVYLNHDKVVDLAEMYSAWPKDVRVVYNARDPRTFWDLHPLTEKIVTEYNLLAADIITVYPLSTPRMISGKGLDRVIRLHACLKQFGFTTRLVVANAHANSHKEKRLISETQIWAHELGLTHNDLIFTSMIDPPEWEMGAPARVVSDLFRLANIFIFPTVSEVCSLVLLEAMMAGNLLVLNRAVESLREFGGTHALYFDFAYREPKEENERYYFDLAKIIASEFENNKTLQVKRQAFQRHSLEKLAHDLDLLIHEEGKTN